MCFFHYFKILIFRVVRGLGGGKGGKRAKNGPNQQKILPVVLHILGTIDHMIVVYGKF